LFAVRLESLTYLLHFPHFPPATLPLAICHPPSAAKKILIHCLSLRESAARRTQIFVSFPRILHLRQIFGDFSKVFTAGTVSACIYRRF
jgi:hypothetical protein